MSAAAPTMLSGTMLRSSSMTASRGDLGGAGACPLLDCDCEWSGTAWQHAEPGQLMRSCMHQNAGTQNPCRSLSGAQYWQFILRTYVHSINRRLTFRRTGWRGWEHERKRSPGQQPPCIMSRGGQTCRHKARVSRTERQHCRAGTPAHSLPHLTGCHTHSTPFAASRQAAVGA